MAATATASRAGRARRQVRLRDLDWKILWPLWVALGYLLVRATLLYYGQLHGLRTDAIQYWLTGHRPNLYFTDPGRRDWYHYAPAFAQLIRPLTLLPWPAFAVVWMLAKVAAFAWLFRPLGLSWCVTGVLACGLDVEVGNITGFLAVAVVLGMRRPQWWAFPILTKVTVGLGPIWFLARGEWRMLARAVAGTAVVVAVSAAIAPADWLTWWRLLVSEPGGPLTPVRLVLAVALTVYAARRNLPWLLGPAMLLATPVLQGLVPYLTILACVPRLYLQRREPATAQDEVRQVAPQVTGRRSVSGFGRRTGPAAAARAAAPVPNRGARRPAN